MGYADLYVASMCEWWSGACSCELVKLYPDAEDLFVCERCESVVIPLL
jgi:hypothetical protein